MKVLCVCQSGNVRSAAIKRVLQWSGYEAINVGIAKNSRETLQMLVEWADLILVPEPWIAQWLEKNLKPRTRMGDVPIEILSIGPDIWKTKTDNHLLRVVKKGLKEKRPDLLKGRALAEEPVI